MMGLYCFICQEKNLGEFNLKRNKTLKEGILQSTVFCFVMVPS